MKYIITCNTSKGAVEHTIEADGFNVVGVDNLTFFRNLVVDPAEKYPSRTEAQAFFSHVSSVVPSET